MEEMQQLKAELKQKDEMMHQLKKSTKAYIDKLKSEHSPEQVEFETELNRLQNDLKDMKVERNDLKLQLQQETLQRDNVVRELNDLKMKQAQFRIQETLRIEELEQQLNDCNSNQFHTLTQDYQKAQEQLDQQHIENERLKLDNHQLQQKLQLTKQIAQLDKMSKEKVQHQVSELTQLHRQVSEEAEEHKQKRCLAKAETQKLAVSLDQVQIEAVELIQLVRERTNQHLRSIQSLEELFPREKPQQLVEIQNTTSFSFEKRNRSVRFEIQQELDRTSKALDQLKARSQEKSTKTETSNDHPWIPTIIAKCLRGRYTAVVVDDE